MTKDVAFYVIARQSRSNQQAQNQIGGIVDFMVKIEMVAGKPHYCIGLKRMPPSVNHYWVRTKKGFFVSKEGQEFKKLIAQIGRGFAPFKGDIALKIELTPSDNRKRDIDNIAKCVLDSLKGVFYDDDSQIVFLEMHKNKAAKEPLLQIEAYQKERQC